MQNQIFQIRCYRKHFFKDTQYILTIHHKTLYLSHNSTPNQYKYQFFLDWETTIHWIINQQQKIEGFGFVGENKQFKQFYGQHEQLVNLKDILSKQVMFSKILNFYQAQNKLFNGNRSEIIQVQRISDGSEQYIAKCYSKDAIEESAEIKKRFYQELNLLARLNHKNIIKMIEVFKGDETIYLIFEKIQGVSLHEYIKQSTHQLNLQIVRQIMMDLFSAVSYLQSLQVIHRMIHPKNLFLDSNNRLIMINFSNYIESNPIQNQNIKNLGYPGYIAPELLNSPSLKDKLNPKIDLFAIGAVFYKLLVRKELFQGQNQEEVIQKNQFSKIDLTKLEQMKIPTIAIDLLKQLLKVDPLDRISIQDVFEHPFFKIDLKQAIQSMYTIKITNALVDKDLDIDYFTQELPSLKGIPIMDKVKGGNREQLTVQD